MKELFYIFIVAILVILAGVTVAYVIMLPLEIVSCSKTAKALGYECEYSTFTGCILIDNNGKKYLLDQLRYIEKKDEK